VRRAEHQQGTNKATRGRLRGEALRATRRKDPLRKKCPARTGDGRWPRYPTVGVARGERSLHAAGTVPEPVAKRRDGVDSIVTW